MRIENDYRLIERLAKRNHRRRLLKRCLALLSAVVLLVTANTLKLKVVAMEHRPTCGYDDEHVHDEACFDEAGNLICSLHEHTDACFQEAPVPEEEELDLSLFDDEDLTDIDDAQAALAANVEPMDAEPEAPLTYEFDMSGGAQVTLGEVLEATGLPVDRAQIQMVGLVDDADLGNDPIAIALVDGDLTITALRAFEAVEIAIVTEQDEILTVTLLNGAPEAAEEEPTEVGEETEEPEDIEQNIDADAADIPEEITENVEENTEENIEENIEENVEENIEENTEENVEENEENLEDVTEENIEENVEENIENNIEENTEENTEVAAEPVEEAEQVEEIEETEEADGAEAVEAVEQADATDDAQEEAEEEQADADDADDADVTEQKEQTEVENGDEAAEAVEEESEEKSEEDKAEESEEESKEEATEESEEDSEEKSEEESEEESEEKSEEEAKEEATEEAEEGNEEKSEEESEEDSAEAEEEEEAAPELTPEEMFAALYPAQSFEAHAENVRVSVTAEVGAFPVGTEMRVAPVWDTDTLDGIAGTVAEDFVEVKKVLAVDIAFFNADGEEIEPLQPISVVMTVEEEIEENQDAVVVHMDDDGNAEVVEQSGLQADDQLALNVEMPAAEDAEAQTEQILAEAAEAIAAGTAEEVEVADEAEQAEAAENADETAEAVENADDATETVADAVETVAEDVPAGQPSIEYGSEDEDAAPAPAAEALEVVAEAAPTQSVAFEADAFSVYAVVVTETIETRYIAADGARFTITVGYGPEAEIPAGAELAVEEIAEGSEAWQGYFDASQAAVSDDDGMIRFARFFDIEIVSEGEKVEPAAPVEVKISYDDPVALSDGEALSVVHFADEGTEVISDLQLSDDATEITYQQASFSVTGTVIQTPESEEHYALVIHHTDGEYYVVENDGMLTHIASDKIGYDDQGRLTVEMVNPIHWTFKDAGYSNSIIYHDTTARAFDWHPENTGNPGSSLPTAYVHRYLTVDEERGYFDINDNLDHDVWSVRDSSRQVNGEGLPYLVLQYDSNNHRINHYDNYLGVTQNSDGKLRIQGLCSANAAATVYLAKAMAIKPVNVLNHTVNHIDISVEGKASIKVPLDYGSYQLAEISDLGKLDDDDLENYLTPSNETLYVTPGNGVTLEVERTIPVDDNDLKKAGLTAYTTWDRSDGSKHYRDDVYNITGYSRNAETNSDTKQVRLEGSFKVSDLESLPDSWDEYKANNWDYYEDGQRIGKVKDVRLDRPIYYSISITKSATFTMTYTTGGKTYVVLDEEGKPMRRTVDVTLAKTFSYWDADNACPGLTVYNSDNSGRSSKERWAVGEMSSNSVWCSLTNNENGDPLDGGPGMDFRLSAEVSDKTNNIVAIQVTKYVQGDFGTEVRMLKLADGTTCAVDVYQNDGDTDPEHSLDLSVTTDGMGTTLDWDVKGGTFANPAKVWISEDPDSVAEELVDNQGRRWVYDRSHLETEVAERHDGQNHPDRLDSRTYTKADSAFYSHEEVLGEYTVPGGQAYVDKKGVPHDGEHEFNRVEEFFIYNIYKPKTYPVWIKKVSAFDNKTLAGAEFDIYGPYDAERNNDTEASGGRKEKKFGSVTVGSNGLGSLGELASGYYYLYETKAPVGFNMLTDAVLITVDSRWETNDNKAVTYEQEGNTGSENGTGVLYDEDTRTYTLVITNNPGVRLPSTGGSGTGAYTLAGAAMALLALALLIAKRREAR